MNEMKISLFQILFCHFIVFESCTKISTAEDTLTFSQLISSNETLISSDNRFQLGFFRPRNSAESYLGIWYNISPTRVIWIANRGNPLNDSYGVLSIGNDGNLLLMDGTETIIWSTKLENSSSVNIVAQLLDSGNLVLLDKKNGSIRWQSFDHPSHALLPGMKLGWDLKRGLNRNLTSWKSSDDPSPGEYTYGFDLHGLPQVLLWERNSKRYRSGPWNGIYIGGLTFVSNLPFTVKVIMDTEEIYYETTLRDNSSLLHAVLSPNGELQVIQWDKNTKNWNELFVVPEDYCGHYASCGPNSICTIGTSQMCNCMAGYVPKSLQEWGVQIWSSGCVRKNASSCSDRRVFVEMENVKVPDFLQFRANFSMSLEECKAECLRNCSCTAYSNANATGVAHGCLIWFGDLIDSRKLSFFPNQKLYIRATPSDLVSKSNSKKKKKTILIVILISASIILLVAVLFFIWKKTTNKRIQDKDKEFLELPCFDMVTIAKATDNFSDASKIGEGGFGPVYKGKLSMEQEIAVKRLSEDSRQGLKEFKNEVMLIAKLQHRNLVRLLGCCIQGDERMLIYEYMANGSLDSYIFGGLNKDKNHLLVWSRRLNIIDGIARGLLYLHRDSRLSIIHRDLKASNVLLDSEMNPKISDFGMARSFGEGESISKTKRVAGTYGYMAPEYVIDGIYSRKSDVFSFGVLVLEIVSGQRNSQFQHVDHEFNLLGHAWQLWLEEKALELIDPLMEDSFPKSEVLRCIQVGLLCVQKRPEDRPKMSCVLLMLNSEDGMLPQPKHPGFFTERNFDETDSFGGRRSSTNEVTITTIEGR